MGVEDMAPHAAYLLQGFDLAKVEEGFARSARRPGTQTWLLAEGSSGWPGAVTFRWPYSDAYGKLTRNHYRVISLSPVPRERCFEIVRGVSTWKPSLLDAQWRWLAADAAVRIFPRQGCRRVDVKLALDSSAPIPANTVTVSLNGLAGATVEIPRGTTSTVRLPVPPTRPVEITIRSARSFETPGPDSRRVAVQLLAVERISR